MRKIKGLFSVLKDWINIQKSFLDDIYYFWKITSKFNASCKTNDDLEKMQYTLLRENHTIEKGLSMRSPKKGFGQEKVKRLLERLNSYFNKYGQLDIEFLAYPLATIQHYIDYTKSKGIKIDEIEYEFNKLLKKSKLVIPNYAGVVQVSKDQVLNECNKSFESLLFSRHSIRYFSNVPVQNEIIEKALNLAQRTPSACNRQGWKTHIFQGEKSIELIKWQGGSRGFENEIKYSILVTANLKAFLYYEIHQAYIDGGLYAMNLINALHSLGLGTIPLSCGFTHHKLKQLSNFNIPENEVPIVIIGIGNLLDNFNVAVSSRKKISETNNFH